MKYLIKLCDRFGLLQSELDYHFLRASMVLIFLFFGYQKWFEYEVERLIPYISNGPLIFWLYPALGMRGATWFLGVSEWTFGTLLFLGFWNRKLGIIGALGSSATFIATAFCSATASCTNTRDRGASLRSKTNPIGTTVNPRTSPASRA